MPILSTRKNNFFSIAHTIPSSKTINDQKILIKIDLQDDQGLIHYLNQHRDPSKPLPIYNEIITIAAIKGRNNVELEGLDRLLAKSCQLIGTSEVQIDFIEKNGLLIFTFTYHYPEFIMVQDQHTLVPTSKPKEDKALAINYQTNKFNNTK